MDSTADTAPENLPNELPKSLLELLSGVSAPVLGQRTLSENLTERIALIRRFFGVDACVVRRLQEGDLVLLGAQGVPTQHLHPRLPVYGAGKRIIETRAPLVIDNAPEDPVTSRASAPGAGYRFLSFVGAPMIAEEEVIGVIGLYADQEPRHFSEEEARLLQVIANHLAAMIRNDELFEAVRRMELRLSQLVDERTSELEQLQAGFESIAYSISHDLRAPLRAIVATSRLLIEENRNHLDGAARTRLDRQADAANRLAGLIDDLLLLSRISREPIHLRQVNVSAMAKELLDRMRSQECPIEIHATIEPNLKLVADERLMETALGHLIENAAKFGCAPLVNIQIRGERRSNGIEIVVEDDGQGFDPAYVPRLFKPFERLVSADVPGNGIGLAAVRRIADRHGGKATGEGRVGGGATFRLFIPTLRPTTH